MLKLLLLCLRAYGFYGVIIYLKFKAGATRSINVPGIPFPVQLRPGTADEYTFREIFLMKEYDLQPEKDFRPKFIIDAGANIGLTSIFFAARYPGAKIVSIEPDTDNFQQLLLNAEPYKQIIPLRAAVWQSEESIKVKDEGYGIRGFMVEKSENNDGLPGVTISGIMNQHGVDVVDILKMDIEGSEKEVMESGFEEWLPKVRVLVIELHDRMKPGCSKAVFTAISKYNFSFAIKGENLVFTNRDI